MRVFTPVIFLGAFLVLIGMPENILSYSTTTPRPPGPHEVWNECGTWCESTCATYPPRIGDSCIAMCKRGYVCERGYIRDIEEGNCIRPSECPPRGAG